MNLGALVVRLLLERAQFRTELAQTVQETNAAASKVQGHAATLTGAVTDAVSGQTTAVQTATRALTVLGPVAATATAAALAVGLAYHQAHQETLGYEKAIILTGNAAGVTSGQLADMARRIDGVAGTQANAAAALASMTAGGKVAQENLEKVATAAIEMERATGQSIGETEKIFSSLGKEPVKASLRLNESMNYLTASTYAQIKAAEDLGDKEAATSIAQNAAADALRDRAGRVEQQLGLLERAWRGVRDVAKEAWDNMLNVGRPDTLSTQIANVRQKIAQAKGEDPNRRFSTPFDTPLAELEQQLAYLNEQERLIRRGTEAQAERNRVQSAGMAAVDALGKANDRAMTRQEQASKALDAYRDSLKAVRAAYEQNPSEELAAFLDPKTIEKAEAAIRKQGETASRTTKAALSDYDKLMKRLGVDVPKAAAEAEAAQHGYNKAQTEFLVLAGSPAWAKFTNEQRASAAAQFEKKIASEQAAEAIKAEEKATVEATKAREKSLATAEKELEKLRASVVAQEEQNARLGLSKEAIAELDAAKLEMLATDVELQAIKVMDKNLDEAQYEILKRQAQAYRDLAQAKRDGAARSAAIESDKALEKAADKAAKEGEKASERIEQSLTDSLMRGFEAGKDMARNLRDTVVNMFKTMVLRPMVSAVVSPVAGAITGMMGLSGAAQAGQGGNAASTAMSAASMFGAGGLGGSLAAGAGWLTGATTLGGSLSAGASLIGAGGAGILPGLGMIAGALGPIAIGIALLSSLIKKSTPHMGAASSYSEAGGLVSGADIYRASGLADTRTYNAGVEQVTGNVAKAIGDTLNATAKAFGQTAGYEITTAFADDTSKDGAWGSLIIKKMGDAVLDWRDTQTSKWAPREFADGEAGSKEYLAEVAKSARDALVGAIGSVDWATGMLQALGEAPTLEGLAGVVEKINAAKAAFVGFGQYMPAFASLADSAVSKLVQASGGVEALAGNMSTFVAEFFTEEERLKVATDNVTAELAKLGYQMPRTRDEFKALLQAQLALGDAGADTAAKLLQLTGAVAAVTQQSATATAQMQAEASDRRAFVKARREMQEAEQKAQLDAMEASRVAAASLFESIKDHIKGIDDWLKGTLLDTSSLLSPEGKVQEARAQFDALYARAAGGDADAMGQLTSAASALRDVARDAYASSGAYGSIEMDLRTRLAALEAGAFDPNRQRAPQPSGERPAGEALNLAEAMALTGLGPDAASLLTSLNRYDKSLIDSLSGMSQNDALQALLQANRGIALGTDGGANFYKETETGSGQEYLRIALANGSFASAGGGANAGNVYRMALQLGLTDDEVRQGLGLMGNGAQADTEFWQSNWSEQSSAIGNWVKTSGQGQDTLVHLYELNQQMFQSYKEAVEAIRGSGSAQAQGQAQQIELLQSVDKRLADQAANTRMGAIA